MGLGARWNKESCTYTHLIKILVDQEVAACGSDTKYIQQLLCIILKQEIYSLTVM